LWTIFIVLGCSVPGNTIPDMAIFTADKFLHFSIFLVWAYLLMASFPLSPVLVMALGLVFGLAIEFYQEDILPYLIPSKRAFEWADAIADGLGAVAGVAVWWLVRAYQNRNST